MFLEILQLVVDIALVSTKTVKGFYDKRITATEHCVFQCLIAATFQALAALLIRNNIPLVRPELAESFKAMTVLKRELKTPVSYHAAGKAGALSRIINPILGGQIIFCVDRYSVSSTKEQLDLRTVRTIVDNMRKI